jgi:hypothetical protein
MTKRAKPRDVRVDKAGWRRSTRGIDGSWRRPIVVPGASYAVISQPATHKSGKPPVDAAGAVDAKNAPTAPWTTAQNAVSHRYHRHSHREPNCYPCSRFTLLPIFPVAQHYSAICLARPRAHALEQHLCRARQETLGAPS